MLKVTGYSLCMTSTAHAHGRFSMDSELTPLVMSSIFFFEPKIAFSIYGSEETFVTNVLYDGTKQGLTEPFCEYGWLL